MYVRKTGIHLFLDREGKYNVCGRNAWDYKALSWNDRK